LRGVIPREAWSFCRTRSSVRTCWELEEPTGTKGITSCSAACRPPTLRERPNRDFETSDLPLQHSVFGMLQGGNGSKHWSVWCFREGRPSTLPSQHNLSAAHTRLGHPRPSGHHQPPQVNYRPLIQNDGFPCRLKAESLVCRGNHHSETGVDSSLEVAGGCSCTTLARFRTPAA
jgi:hypothetical protein